MATPYFARKFGGVRDAVGGSLRAPGGWTRLVVFLFASLALGEMAWIAIAPFFADMRAMGFHDWDSAASYRFITVVAIKRYHELPFWNPYLCGGFPGWAYAEGASNLVSPYLPAYLALPLPAALRIEILGSVVTSFVCSYLLATRFTKSIALAALVAGVYTLNGRWALQVSSGHSWHLQFAWAPLVIYFIERAIASGRMRMAVYAGMVMALMFYMGAIYPLPHVALLLCLYSLVLALWTRRFRPLIAVAVAGFSSIGFAAPKLFAVIDLMQRFDRKIESTEAIGLEQMIQMLANPAQTFYQGTSAVPAYGWHEWGTYVGWAVVALMALPVFFGRGARENALRIVGLVFWVLGLGAFHPDAPWTLLHKMPAFSSQHVPSRFMYLGILMMLLAFLALVSRRLDNVVTRFPIFDLLLLVPVHFIFVDIATVDRKTTESVFYMQVPPTHRHETFKQVRTPGFNYAPADAWAGPSYPMMEANEGYEGCYSVPDRADPKGALASDVAGYRGEAYVDGAGGEAHVTRWSTNRVDVAYSNVAPGSVVVLNSNYDPSWRADGARALDHKHAVAKRVDGGSGTVSFRYFPRTLIPSLFVFALTLFVTLWLPGLIARRRTMGPA